MEFPFLLHVVFYRKRYIRLLRIRMLGRRHGGLKRRAQGRVGVVTR